MSDWDDLMGNHTPAVRGIAVKTRRLVKKLLPGTQEVVRMGWKAATYSPDGGMKNAICSLGPQKSHVNLVFSKGAALKDPKGLLDVLPMLVEGGLSAVDVRDVAAGICAGG